MIARNQQLAISAVSPTSCVTACYKGEFVLDLFSHSLPASECFSEVEGIPPSKFWLSDSRSPYSNQDGPRPTALSEHAASAGGRLRRVGARAFRRTLRRWEPSRDSSPLQIGVAQESHGENVHRNMSWAGYDRALAPGDDSADLFDRLFGVKDQTGRDTTFRFSEVSTYVCAECGKAVGADGAQERRIGVAEIHDDTCTWYEFRMVGSQSPLCAATAAAAIPMLMKMELCARCAAKDHRAEVMTWRSRPRLDAMIDAGD